MTLSSLNYEAPMATKSTGLGSRFVTPQRAKVERSGQFQKMDLFGSQNMNKPKQPLEQAPILANPISQNNNIFGSPDQLNSFDSAFQANLAGPDNNPAARMNILSRAAQQGRPVDSKYFLPGAGRMLPGSYNPAQSSSIPRAGQALSEPYKPSNTSNSSYNFPSFENMLKSIQAEQGMYKQVSDPNFKSLSEDEMAAQANERFNKTWANKTWKDYYTPLDPADVQRQRQGILDRIKKGKASQTQLNMFDAYKTNKNQEASAIDLFNRNKEAASKNYLSEIRQTNASKQYFDSEEGKKRAEAGKKLLEFYGNPNDLVIGDKYTRSEAELKFRETGGGSTPAEKKVSKLLGPLTPYEKAYRDELAKGSTADKARDKVMQDFNKSVGLTGNFVPYGYNKFNQAAQAKSMSEKKYFQNLTPEELKKETIRQAFYFDPMQKFK